MRQHNQEKQSVQKCSTENTSIELFQSISDEQAETIKGGWFPWGGAGNRFYCVKSKQVKEGTPNY